jgi:hypothetical protein
LVILLGIRPTENASFNPPPPVVADQTPEKEPLIVGDVVGAADVRLLSHVGAGKSQRRRRGRRLLMQNRRLIQVQRSLLANV